MSYLEGLKDLPYDKYIVVKNSTDKKYGTFMCSALTLKKMILAINVTVPFVVFNV